MLTILDALPPTFLEIDATRLYTILRGPTLIHLTGRMSSPLFVSILLHGNEDTGLRAVQSLLRDYRGRELPRALSIFIGNVAAARLGVRRLVGQPDYNRNWAGDGTPEHRMMRQVVDEMRTRQVFASVDIHNNTGINPQYACVNRLENSFLNLATLFNRTVVYFTRPKGAQSQAFAELCPAVTLECGQVGQRHGIEHARAFIEACLHLSEMPEHPVAAHDMDLFHTVATVNIPPDVSFGFGAAAADIRFVEDLDQMNFSELPANTALGWICRDSHARLEVLDEDGQEVGARYFVYRNNEIRTTIPIMPSMLTLDARIIRQDCLCYLMERLDPCIA